MRYKYRAVDDAGNESRGILDADTPLDARAALRAQGVLPISLTGLEPIRDQRKSPMSGMAQKLRPGMSRRVLSQITRQLASLVSNGIRIEDALQIVGRQGVSEKVAATLNSVRALILEGRSLPEAFGAQGGAFPRHYIVSIGAGEASGNLAPVLESLADYTQLQNKTQQSIQLALIYPGFLALVSAAIIFALLTQVVPDIVAVYRRRGDDLPGTTRLLIALSSFLVNYGVAILIAGIAIGVSAFLGFSGPAGKLRLGRWLISAPLTGSFERKRLAAQVSATLAMLIRSGVPFVDALKVSANVVGNHFVRRELLGAADEIRDGRPVEDALRSTRLLPPGLLAVIANAVKSGGLELALSRAAQEEQSELDAQVKALVALLEPAVLLAMGGFILFIVMAILTPIVNLNTLAGS